MIDDRPAAIPLSGVRITCAADMAALVRPLRSPFVESMKVAWIDADGRPLGFRVTSLGCLDHASVEWRELVRNPPKGTTGIVLAHNHPSGNPTPSSDDLKLTQALQQVVSSFGLVLYDHVLTNGRTFFSMASADMVKGLPRLPGDSQRGVGLQSLVAEDSSEYAGLSPWERIARDDLPILADPKSLGAVVEVLRQASPSAGHVLFVGTKNNLQAVERVGLPASERGWEALAKAILRGAAEEGATGVMLDLPADHSSLAPRLRRLQERLKAANIRVVDVLDAGMASAQEAGLLRAGEDHGEYGEAVGI
jgi:hypothetical protein